jgi:hypothetical protein
LPWGYSQIIQDRLKEQGVFISRSMIQKVRVNVRVNLPVMRELKKLSDEYTALKSHT